MTFKEVVKLLCKRYHLNASAAAETAKQLYADPGDRAWSSITPEQFEAKLDELEALGTKESEANET